MNTNNNAKGGNGSSSSSALTTSAPAKVSHKRGAAQAAKMAAQKQQDQSSTKGKVQVDRALLSKAHYMMRPFILRRLKAEVEQTLPPKLETKIDCPMTSMQRFWVRRLLVREKELLIAMEMKDDQEAKEKGSDKEGEKKNNDGSGGEVAQGRESESHRRLQSLVTQLRKAANHPYLFQGVETPSADGRATEELVKASGKMVVLDQLLKKLHQRGHRVVLFSQYTRMLDIISDYLDMRGYHHCRLDGSTNRVMREVYINMFNRPQSDLFIFCLSTRAGGEGVNLFTADTVILFDSDWNPQVDIQAMARVHRIGQKKTVHIYRLVSQVGDPLNNPLYCMRI